MKLLGLTISRSLTWYADVCELVEITSEREYFLVQLKRAKVALQDLVLTK